MTLMDLIADAWVRRQERRRFRRMVEGVVWLADDWTPSSRVDGAFRTDRKLTSNTLSATITWVEKLNFHSSNDHHSFKLKLPGETIIITPEHEAFMAKLVRRLSSMAARAERCRKEQEAHRKLAQWAVDNERLLQKAELRRDMGLTITPAELTEAFDPPRLPRPDTLIPPPRALKGSFWEGEKIVKYHPGPHQFELENGQRISAELVCEAAKLNSVFRLAA